MAFGAGSAGSILAVEELFARADAGFLEELRKVDRSPQLAGFADRWKKDPRPWARQQILAYLDLPLDRRGHHPVVKRLFKQAESAQDYELLAAFLIAFDRLIRRVRAKRRRYDWDAATRTSTVYEEEWLASPRNALPAQRPPSGSSAKASRDQPAKHEGGRRSGVLFSYATRRYLRRRVWRNFRQLGRRSPTEFVPAAAQALRLYRDEDLSRGEHILDSWSFVHICFHDHPALEFKPSRVVLRESRTLAELSPAPCFPELWRTQQGAAALWELLFAARSRAVRVWALQLLKRDHVGSLSDVPVDVLRKLLDHADEELQLFGAGLLADSPGAAKWTVTAWLDLLTTKSPSALAIVCDAMQRHVVGARLDLSQRLQLACAKPVPVAGLGLKFLRDTPISAAERSRLAVLGEARCATIGGELAQWALGVVGTSEGYDLEALTRFFDSLLPEMRQAAWDWLTKSSPARSPGYDDPALWSRLLETPFDDLRLRLIDHLALRASGGVPQRAKQADRASAGDLAAGKVRWADSRRLAPVWCSVLLGVHRGGRQKAKAVAQVAAAILESPELAEELLPVLAAALRSVRLPEFRAAISAVAQLVHERPELESVVREKLPELNLVKANS